MQSDTDFNAFSFYDNHVHGLSIEEGEYGSGKLVLDIDHIIEWLPSKNDRCTFRLAPAFLSFHDITNLAISINYAAASAGIVPFSIHEIRRELISYPNGFETYQWQIALNWPQG